MRTLKVYRNGFSLGTPPKKVNTEPPKRGVVQGWSKGAVRRNTDFLRSINVKKLTGYGYAITLTLRYCPETGDDWQALRQAYVERLRRLGMIRLHWVAEWQRRGVPHLHMCVYFSSPVDQELLLGHWLNAAARYSPNRRSQHIATIFSHIGWAKYLAKHASRGVYHYQRNAENIPKGWQGRTGRVWGKSGDWPTDTPIELHIDRTSFFRMRRVARRLRIAEARANVEAKRLHWLRNLKPEERRFAAMHAPLHVQYRQCHAYKPLTAARRMLKRNERKLSNVCGLNSWINEEQLLQCLPWLESLGGYIIC